MQKPRNYYQPLWAGSIYDPYIAVLVVEVDDESEWPPSHWLCGDERVLKGGLSAGRNHDAELESGEVLDVELVILTGTNRTKLERAAQKCFAAQIILFVALDPEKSKVVLVLQEGTLCVFFVPVGNGKRRPETPQ